MIAGEPGVMRAIALARFMDHLRRVQQPYLHMMTLAFRRAGCRVRS